MSDVIKARLAALEEAIAMGVAEFTYDGQQTKYRTLEEMWRLRDELREQLKAPTSNDGGVWFSDHEKGYQ